MNSKQAGGATRREALALASSAAFAKIAWAKASERAGAASGKTLLVSHPSSLDHDPGPGQPDRPERLNVILRALADDTLPKLARAEAPKASREAIASVHSPAHLALVERAAPHEGRANLGPDLAVSAGSLAAALHAAGGAILAVDEVTSGRARNAFVAMRPPGHHATRETPMGFCFFNNAAIAARHALTAHGVERVAIVDFDVHHGNGVQEIFWTQQNVLYCSTHQAPLYPGTGASSERGECDNIVNAPLRKGDGGEEFHAAYASRILPRVEAFAPDLVVLCAGFDAHIHDPLGGLRLRAQDFGDVTKRLMDVAERRCQGRIVSLLEGGYNLDHVGACALAHVRALSE